MTPESDLQLIIPQLIVGLGNPEPKYDRTRHNIGFDAVDALVSAWQMSWKDNKRFQGLLAEGISPYGQKVRLLKPLTYMNRSGQAVRAVADWHKIPIESILIIYDDMDLPVGKMRMRLSGSAGGHNGMKSIIAHLGGQNFPRLRIGIGKSGDKLETIGHVLGKFSPSESEVMREVLNLSVQAIELSLKQGVEKSMSRYNGMSISNK
jgi:PTH1 family peptidyl-tRNA hydrolase